MALKHRKKVENYKIIKKKELKKKNKTYSWVCSNLTSLVT